MGVSSKSEIRMTRTKKRKVLNSENFSVDEKKDILHELTVLRKPYPSVATKFVTCKSVLKAILIGSGFHICDMCLLKLPQKSDGVSNEHTKINCESCSEKLKQQIEERIKKREMEMELGRALTLEKKEEILHEFTVLCMPFNSVFKKFGTTKLALKAILFEFGF